MEPLDLITIVEAARRLKLSRQSVYEAIWGGRLTRHERYGKMLVDAAEIAAYKPNNYGEKRHRGPGRPRKTVGTE
jgi:hypothetical protein